MSRNDPAYPVPNSANVNGQEGLTKRELLAAMAMQGMLANPGGPVQASSNSGWQSTTNCNRGDVANEAVQFADALIAELAKDGVE